MQYIIISIYIRVCSEKAHPPAHLHDRTQEHGFPTRMNTDQMTIEDWGHVTDHLVLEASVLVSHIVYAQYLLLQVVTSNTVWRGSSILCSTNIVSDDAVHIQYQIQYIYSSLCTVNIVFDSVQI